jgi:ParB family chromosome partitioning protein
MSKAAESLQRRFGQNLSESLGVRASGGGSIGPPPPMGFPRETSPDDGRTRARDAGHMEIDRIVPDPDQPRKEFSDDAIERLAASLLKHGQLMPIRVRWNPKIGKWVVISGERRYRAATRAGLRTVACVFADDGLSPSEILQEQIVENLLREDLKPIEQARAYRQLMDLHGWTAKELSGELQVSQGAVSKSLSLLTLPVELQEQVDEGSIPATAAYEVAKVEDKEVQREIARRIVDEDLTRDAAAEVVREAAGKPTRNTKAKGRGGASGRGSSRVFKAAGAKVAVTFPRKTVRDEDILAALEDAAEQIRAGLRAKDPAWAWRADFPGKSIA